jgi:hypothetical protein
MKSESTTLTDWLEWFVEEPRNENSATKPFAMPDGWRGATDGKFAVCVNDGGPFAELTGRKK